ncbi:hypothetical protein MIND_00326300 [Mycena indigotica]|uniref:Uncharacterized protein n=1 Tax=Mycena indigotica TaxID=2126181 RepID=A0A8H6W8D3_9AGAR|nr:uncharacterized protein MIND_00326300 [Mycena indigotica]KAF7309554.1 hypothetical protein MIND_00326300 [Mycena indigotica]
MAAPEPPPRSQLRPPSAVISARSVTTNAPSSSRTRTVSSSKSSAATTTSTTKHLPSKNSSLSRATAASAQKQVQPSLRVRTTSSSSSKPELVVPRSRTSSIASASSNSRVPSSSVKRPPGSTNTSVGRANGRMLSEALALPESSESVEKVAESSTLTRTQPSIVTPPVTPGRALSVYAPSSAALRRAANGSENTVRSSSSSRSVSPASAIRPETFASARAVIARGRERSAARSPISPVSPESLLPQSATTSTSLSPNNTGAIGPMNPTTSAAVSGHETSIELSTLSPLGTTGSNSGSQTGSQGLRPNKASPENSDDAEKPQRSDDCERERLGVSHSRECQQLPFPHEDGPVLPSPVTTSSSSSPRAKSTSTPSNSHIPLAMQHRHRKNSDPHAKLLTAAAFRAPAQYVSQQSQRTPERGTGGLERQGSLQTPELVLDMKRLLSKPVSVARLHSDSEEGTSEQDNRRPSSDSRSIRRKHYDATGRGEDARQIDPSLVARKSGEYAKHRSVEKTEREVALALVGHHTSAPDKDKEKRPKNVLRRRSSAQRPQTTPTPNEVSPVPRILSVSRKAPPTLSLDLPLDTMQMSGSESPNGGNGPLTPAGAVVAAYKRSRETTPNYSPTSPTFERHPSSHQGQESPALGTPYYTVFGSTSGRIIAVGGPEDSWDGVPNTFPTLDGMRRAKNSVGRTLTRKVSERWSKKREDGDDDLRGRPSLQSDRRKKSTRSASRVGTEESPADDPEFPRSPIKMAHETSFTNEPRSRRSEPALGGGNKIWKLMKRISTGGLKEKYDRDSLPPMPPMPQNNVPPVPQLPPKQSLEARMAMSSDGHSQEPGALSRFMESRTSMSVTHRPSARTLPVPPPIPVSQSQPRTSTTTRSSSPLSSSDVASSKYFHKTTGSGRSSTSSYEAESAIPPLPHQPNVVIGKHILPPKELYKLESDFRSQSLDDNKNTFLFHSLTPPRRLPTPNVHTNERRLSDAPSIPEFSTAAPINAFSPRKQQLPVMDRPRVESLLTSLGPAPSRRSTSSVSERSGAYDDTFGRHNWRTSSAPSSSSHQKRLKHQQRATSIPRIPQEPLTFREMGQKSAGLTEQEKASKWEDLLERSNRAGGTIHLGNSDKLASDDISLRYSASSSQLLRDF